MAKQYTPAVFQATIRPSWAGALSYITEKEKAKIFEAIVKYPVAIEIDSVFWTETIKPDLDAQYEKFLSTCEARGRGAKTYWGEHKLSLSNTYDEHKVNLLKDKDKDKDKVKNKVKVNDNNKYGELKNVCLSEDQYNTLSEKYDNLDDAIEVLDTWLGTSGSKHKNKNHFAYFKANSWVWDRVRECPAIKNAQEEKERQEFLKMLGEC